MTRDEILAAARQCVSVDRAATYGEASKCFRLIAGMWSEAIGGEWNFSADEVAVFMALMKIGRARMNPKHADSWVDACGYLALAGELSTQQDV